jgi:hypothetical protein
MGRTNLSLSFYLIGNVKTHFVIMEKASSIINVINAVYTVNHLKI